MNNIMKSKTVMIASIFLSLYFLFLVLNTTIFKLDYIWIGVIQNIITIPALLALIGLGIVSVIFFKKENFKLFSYSFASIVILSSCVVMLIVNS